MTAPLTLTGLWDARRIAFSPDHMFLEDCTAIPHHAQLTAVLTTDRSPDQLRAYWATLGNITRSGAWDGDKDSLDDYTRIGVGFGTWRPLATGNSVFIPNSIALSKCDGVRFNRYMHFAERLWSERLGVDVAELRREAERAKERRAA